MDDTVVVGIGEGIEEILCIGDDASLLDGTFARNQLGEGLTREQLLYQVGTPRGLIRSRRGVRLNEGGEYARRCGGAGG